MLPVTVTKITDAGTFTCRTKHTSNNDDDGYLEFLGSLNTYVENNEKDVYIAHPLKVGTIYAVYTDVKGSQSKLWYRGQVLCLFKSINGVIARVMLIDEGDIVFVTKARLRHLNRDFVDYPHQVMSCALNGLVPISLTSDMELKTSLQNTQHWNVAAMRFVEDLLTNRKTAVEIVTDGVDGFKNVILYYDDGVSWVSVNDLLITNNYAVFQYNNEKAKHSPTPEMNICDHDTENNNREEQLKKTRETSIKDCEALSKLLDCGSKLVQPMQLLPKKRKTIPLVKKYKEITESLSSKSSFEGCSDSDLNAELSQPLATEPNLNNEITQPETLPIDMSSSATQPFLFVDPVSKVTTHNDSLILKTLLIGDNKHFLPAKNDNTLVYGKLKREPFKLLSELHLPTQLKQALRGFATDKPTSFQSHVFPALMAFRHLVGITDSRECHISKTISYIVPIMKSLVENEEKYKALGKGNGPYFIICAADWMEARHVYDVCEKFGCYYKKKIRVDVFYGGMDHIEERNIRLINGCEILITTAPALNHALNNSYTNLKRLCHIVFDNADILVENFTAEIKLIMRLFAHSLKETQRTESMQQIVVVGMKWTNGLRSFMESYLTDPLVIIDNRIEASLFANVPLVVEICDSSQRFDLVVGFIEMEAAGKSTIIFTISANNADSLCDSLMCCGYAANVITEFMSPAQISDARLMWNESMHNKHNILILSDKAVLQADIKNAAFIIHYDFCQKKSDFGNRLNCLLDTLRENENATTKTEVYSYIFITEQDNGMRHSTSLVKLLRQSGQYISEELQSLALASRDIKEAQNEFSDLCPHLKLYGYCSDMEDCNERHKIFPHRDLLELCPSTGFVKVKVLDVVNASTFWGRILEHTLPFDKEATTYDTTQYVRLSMEIQLHFAERAVKQPCSSVEKYDICVVHTTQGYQRVRVEKVLTKELEKPKKLKVFGVDSGMTFTAQYGDLLVCPDHLKSIPHQAIEIIASCVKPVDKATHWTYEASLAMEKKVHGETLEGRIQFSLRNTMWLDPLVKKELLSGVQTKTYSVDVGRGLINEGFAEINKMHIVNLRALLCEAQGYTVNTQSNKKNLPISMIEHESAYLEDEVFEEVYVSAVINPHLFFVQRAENVDKIDKLDDKIDATMSVTKVEESVTESNFPVGYICVAQFTEDKRWYRARICGVNNTGEYNVFFIDHGEQEWLPQKRVAPAWPDILNAEFQAIQCCCVDIAPHGTDWQQSDIDSMFDVIHDKLLTLKVRSTEASKYVTDTICYHVDLYDSSRNIAHELVARGAAKPSEQCILEMFPYALNDDNIKKNSVFNCANLCVDVYQTQDSKDQLEKADVIKKIVMNCKNNNDLVESGCVHSLSKLFTLTHENENVQSVLLECLHHTLKASEQNCDILIADGLFKIISGLLRKTSIESLQIVTLEIVIECRENESLLQHLFEYGFVNSCCILLKASKNVKISSLALRCVAILADFNKMCCTILRQDGGIDAILKLMETTDNEEFLVQSLNLLQVVLDKFRNQEYFRDAGGLKTLLMLMKKKLMEKMVGRILDMLQLLVTGNEGNRNYLHKENVHEEMKLYACLRYSTVVKSKFKTLIAQIASPPVFLHAKSSQRITVPRIKNDSAVTKLKMSNIGLTPKVLWSQRCETVTLSIRLRGVHTEETTFSETSMTFKTNLDGKDYAVDFEFYGKIIPEDCEVCIKGAEVLITLPKLNREVMWPRLLKTLAKVAHVGVDYDRLLDSDNDSDELANNDIWDSLPPPPKCEAYGPDARPTVIPLDARQTSSDDISSGSDDGDDFHEDFFSV